MKYIRANYLLQECEKARETSSYFDYNNRMSEYDLLVIDDFGLMELDLDKCRNLFEIIESRDSAPFYRNGCAVKPEYANICFILLILTKLYLVIVSK